MHKQLKQAIDLSRKTGDRLIVYDMSQDDSAFVVMDLDEYEKIAMRKKEIHDLTEDELLDKINRDIATWQSEQFIPKEGPIDAEKILYESDNKSDYEPESEETNRPKYQIREEKEEPKQEKNSQWRIPSERKENAEEVIEEDRQYLEEVKF